MTKIEEKVIGAMGALLLLGGGWMGQNLLSLENSSHQTQVALAENKVLILQVQKDISEIKITQNDSSARISALESRMAQTESSVSYIGKKLGL